MKTLITQNRVPYYIICLLTISLLSLTFRYLGYTVISMHRISGREKESTEITIGNSEISPIDMLILGMMITQLIYAPMLLHSYHKILEKKFGSQSAPKSFGINKEQVTKLEKMKREFPEEDIGELLWELNCIIKTGDVKRKYKNHVILLTSWWNDIRSQNIAGTLDREEYQRYCQKLRRSMLSVIDQLLQSYIRAGIIGS